MNCRLISYEEDKNTPAIKESLCISDIKTRYLLPRYVNCSNFPVDVSSFSLPSNISGTHISAADNFQAVTGATVPQALFYIKVTSSLKVP